MDRIEKALIKARTQRKARLGTAGAKPGSGHAKPAVAYDKTRVHNVTAAFLRERRVVTATLRDPHADRFRMLRAQVLQRLDSCAGSTLGVCSPNPQEGKTLTAVNLAVSLAMDVNHTVLLVDLDLRQPSLSEYFGLNDNFGLSDYLSGQSELSDCLVNPGITRLVLLPAGRALHNSSEMLSSPKMVQLAQELKTRYPDRLVIYDLPPLLASDDSMVFLPQIDASLLVVQEGKTRAGEIRRALDLLGDSNLLGTVLNQSTTDNRHPNY